MAGQMSGQHVTDQVATGISVVADALAQALPLSVINRLGEDLGDGDAQSAELVFELARARANAAAETSRESLVPRCVRDDGGTHASPMPSRAADSRLVAELVLPELVSQITDLGIDLSDDGNHERALAVSARAVDVYCALAHHRPIAHLPTLAASLNNISVDFAHVGRLDEAYAAAEQSVAIRRYLAAEQPDLFLKDLAVSLNNLGGYLARLGQADAALSATKEAAQIRIVLAEHAPADFLPVLASTLTNLGITLADLGRYREAEALGHLVSQMCRRMGAARVR